MAILKIDFASKVLGRTVPLEVLIPLESLAEGEKCGCLYLLHGVQGNYINWLTAGGAYRQLGIYHTASARKLAIVMPSGANSFYQAPKAASEEAPLEEDYARFIGEELPAFTRQLLPLSSSRQDTYVAGLSMGGYGALRIGLLYPHVFGFAGGLSAALLTQDRKAHCREDGGFYEKPDFWEATFGDLEGIQEDARDVKSLSLKLHEAGVELPKLYMACGKQDALLPLSRELHESWKDAGIAHRYEERNGGHDWVFWQWGLSRILRFIGVYFG